MNEEGKFVNWNVAVVDGDNTFTLEKTSGNTANLLHLNNIS